ncbi:MAG TPA: GntR family transcriptional regulator [Streptosporangiaceae bacterium]
MVGARDDPAVGPEGEPGAAGDQVEGLPLTEIGAGTGRPDLGGRTPEDVRRILADQISAGRLRPGQRLGAERALASALGVSRATLRQALAVLEENDLVRRVPGRGGGTFVSRAKIERDLSRVVGVPALLRSQGVVAGTRVLSARLAEAEESAMHALRLRGGDLVIDLVRIRLADGSPISVEHAMLPADRFPGLLELPLGGSVYELLEERYGTRPKQAVERIEVVIASPDEAMILDVPSGAPLLSITRTTTDADDEPFEFSHDLFRGDRTRIVVHTPGHGGIPRASPGRGQVIELRAQAGP